MKDDERVQLQYIQISMSAIKGKLSQLILLLYYVVYECAQQSCNPPFTAVSNYDGSYCVKCDTTCSTCFDDSVNGCVTCIEDFSLDQNSSFCIPPDTGLIHTVESSYKYYKFTPYGNWTGATVIDCQYTTVLIPTPSTGPLTVKNYLRQHYGLRIIVSAWWFTSSVTTNDTILIQVYKPLATNPFYSNDSITFASAQWGYNGSNYCAGSFATNFDTGVFNGRSTEYVTVKFSSTSTSWGIRQYVLIQYLCNTTYCKTCTGQLWNNCTSCTDPRRKVQNGQCRCDPRKLGSKGYFKHPDGDYCVFPCPSRPSVGRYYGDVDTQQCVLSCYDNSSATHGVMFADDVSGQCVPLCPATISLGTEASKPLYHDVENRRCVTNCPSSAPYKYTPNRTCLASCPNSPTKYYKNDMTMTCVTTCPSNQIIRLFKDDFLWKCVDDCQGTDWWADYLTGECTATCSGTDYFEDNTTTRNKCVEVCPAPLYFGDKYTGKCIDHCYGGKFGDTAPGSLRHCVVTCSSDYYGLLTGNRACVKVCPNQTWGEDTKHTCVLATTDCDADRYADNFTHKCVPKGTCSFGQYSTDVDTKCTMICPNDTYADDQTRHCQTGCSGDYFADPGIPKCVKVCQSPDLYADVGSNNMCVQRCNQSESTPYRQFSKRKCVDKCPNDPYTFSDPDAEACVYNCSIGRYKDDLSDPLDKRCVENCTVPNWGDNSTGYGECVRRCPQNPPLFGDTVSGFRVCIEVCQEGTFGDQSPDGYRQCIPTCPDGYFAQDDELRRCVLVCNETTFGTNKVCVFPENCPAGQVGDPSTNLCTNLCPLSQGTFADDIVSYTCVQRCPVNNSILYFADPTDRWCRDTCTASAKLFGNNDTQTCEKQCIDYQSYADHIHPNRYCIANCTDDNQTNGTNTTSDDVLVLYYRNNYTKTCVVSMGCPFNYFADNITKDCVSDCPMNESSNQTWGHRPTKTCVQMCYGSLWGDDSTGIALCVPLCPSLPPKWSYDPEMLCVTECPANDSLWGEDYTRTCIDICPMHPTIPDKYTYAYNVTRRCLQDCPQGYFSDKTARMCWDDPANCSYGWGDDYNNSCTTLCTGPQPWNSFGDNLTHLCTIRCSIDSYADNYTSTRICVAVCPGTYDADGVPDPGSFDSFGDNSTQSCVLHCVSPDTWADWQTHRCQSRCTGDDNTTVPTYSENVRGRCVIALWCPKSPDKLYGDNNTRSCVTTCHLDLDQDNLTEWADNITRTCIPQCLNYTNPDWNTTIQWDGMDTRFYGDTSTNSPICVVKCPRVPRLFGQNSTNRCVEECPDNQYGDQTGNRSCVSFCPIINGVIWFTQITKHICVTLCEEGTWGNVHGQPHCQTVPTDCIEGQYADNSTNMCVPLCPEDQNYFGDPSTRLCVDRCPYLNGSVINTTANISMEEGYLYADYSTRLCVYRCPDNFGPYGTWGDNQTNTCVYRCPPGSFGDWQTDNRYCVEVCTAGTFADELTQTCVSQCPSSPPYFAELRNWTCVLECPNGTWASDETRTCVEQCPIGKYRLTDERTQCVEVCPSSPDLYSDPQTNNCITRCQEGNFTPFADPTDRMCKDSCAPLFEYDYRCVKYCPNGYYANSTNNCVRPTECDDGLYADNATTKCISPCVAGAFADNFTKYCIAVCPEGWYGDIDQCVQNCTTPNTSSSQITQVCQSICPNYTYSQNYTCKQVCQYGYANDVLKICAPGCPSGLFADPLTHDCVADCYDNQTNDTQDWFRNRDTGFCVDDCGTKFKDFITGDCVDKCSDGYWGNKGNMTCIPRCIDGEYGYEGDTQRTCYAPADLPGYALLLFGDPISGQYVVVCPTIPDLYFGDNNLHECVKVCQNHSTTDYYGDPSTRQCQTTCRSPVFYTADPATWRCELKCTQGTFRFNTTPICMSVCPVGFADDTTNVCVDICPYWADTFGYHNLTSNQRICVLECPVTYYAEPVRRTCSLTCDSPYFAYNDTHQCVTHCIDSFADQSNRRCVESCFSNSYPNADNSTNRCVFRCPPNPDYYADNHICVYYCSNPDDFADPESRSCVARCPNTTNGNTYGDPTTRRCVYSCPLLYFADDTTNKCVRVCPALSYGYNASRQCLPGCPVNQSLFADPYTHMCAYTCSNGFFGSNITQECVRTCDADYWGNPLNTLCTQECPNTIYSFGQNTTRTCVTSCINYTGFADNMTRICRDVCQNLSNWLTFADPTTKSCVQMCPSNYYMENTTNQCRQQCLTGFADNYSRFCVAQCPDKPQSYGDTILDVCLYQCLRNQFSDNSTNLCVFQCPSVPDYYGDPNNHYRCVLFCSEGLWAQNSSRKCVPQCDTHQFADNLTRRCVRHCPVSQSTFADETTHKCVRVCPPNYWADNSTQTCTQRCPDLDPNGTLVDTYSDNFTHYCVLTCPHPTFGRKDTNKCVYQCPSTPNLFGHPEGRICVDVTNCFAVDGIPYYADDTTRRCVQKCPLNRWADTNLSKCVETCPRHYFRNNNNQECVSNCPEDPDEYASPTSRNCTRKCPTNYYAVVNSTGFRLCVQDCHPYGLIKNNITKKCVPLNQCSTDPFMFGDPLLHACVLYCSGTYFADNKTQTCVHTCPSEWELFGSLDTYECVELCPNYKFADELYTARPRTCREDCDFDYFKDNQTSRCVQRCSEIKPFYYQDDRSFSCVEVCPGQSYAYNPNQTCLYSTLTLSGYVSQCPDDYFADTISRTCVKLCPIGYYAKASTKYCVATCTGSQFADNQTRTCTTVCSAHYFSLDVDTSAQVCVQFCPDPYYAENSTKKCVTGCSVLLALNTTRSCQNYCPDPYLAQWDINKCVLTCDPNFADFETRTCINPCVAPAYSNPINFTCDLLCPQNYFGRNTSRECHTTCLNDSYADPHSRICVRKCPFTPLLFADDRTNECVPICIYPLFAYVVDRTCVEFCPNVSNDVYLADQSNRKCVIQCVNAEDTYADYSNNECTDFCPNGTFASNYTKQCVPLCPNDPNDTFSYNVTHICMDICHVGFGYSGTLNCVAECWWPLFADRTTRLCVDYCPDGYFGRNESATCQPTCQPGTYADPTTHRCVRDCPDSQDLFKFENWTCLATCPTGFFANRNISSCVQICDSTAGMYAYSVDNTCVMECPFPYRGYDPEHICILNCPSLYFYNKTRNVCTRCPMECLTCTGPNACMTCVAGKNLFNGQCSASCQPLNGFITYAHPTTNMCVSICPPTYFGDNSTYTCTRLCPNKQYGSTATGLCQHCPLTCALCLNTSYCTSCQANSTMAIDNMCYSHCSLTQQYYYSTACYSTCPPNTFVSYTGVHCIDCSNLCGSCYGTASNCTTCFDRYFFNFTCVTQCPSGYYGSSSLQCTLCTSSTSQVCAQPLSFTTSVSIQNYQYVVSLKFNQQVSIQRQIQQILKVELKVSRRLLDTADLINNGVGYTWKLLSDGTIKLYLNIDTDLNQPQFTVRFTDPTAIISLINGASLQDVATDFNIEKVEYYPPEDGKDIGIKKVTLFTVVFVLLLYCVTVLFTDAMVKPVQMLQIIFFHCVTTAPMSASLYFFLLELKPALLQFLPNLLSGPLAKDITLHATSTQKTIDVFVDYNFFRNVGQILFMILIFFFLWALFMILSNRRIVQHKIWHNFFELVSIRRFRFSLLNDIMSVLYIPILWFGFSQFQQLFNPGYLGFNGFICLIIVVFSVLYPFGLIYVWWKKEPSEIQEKFPFMCNRLNKNKEKASLQIPATYLYLLFSVIWLVGLDKKTTAQMVMLFITNLVYAGYLIVARPFSIHVNTILAMVWCGILMTIQVFLIYFDLNNLKLKSSAKTLITNPLLITISVFMMILIIWSVWRSVWQFMDIWQAFKETEFYKHYGDPDVQVKSEVSEVYNRYQKVAVNVQPTVGDIVIDKMYKECNEKGENVIKVRKKVLKKKPKVKGRGKKQAELQDGQTEEFVRINKVNPFDYDYDEDFKQKEQKKQTMKRAVDDDLRDISSDDQEKKYSKKQAKQQSQKRNVKNIEVEKEQKRIIDIHDIDQIISVSSEQKINKKEIEEKKEQHKDISQESDEINYLEVESEESKQQEREPQHKIEESIKDVSENFDFNIEDSEEVLKPPKLKENMNQQSLTKQQQEAKIAKKEEPAIKQEEQEQYGQFDLGSEVFDQPPQRQKKEIKHEQIQLESQILDEPQEQKKEKDYLVQQKKEQNKKKETADNLWDDLVLEDDVVKEQKKQEKVVVSKPKGIEQLLQEEQGNKKKKLLFLFDDLEDD